MNNKMIDRDLDVQNILKDFPENDNDVALYLRGNVQIDDDLIQFTCENAIIMIGDRESLSLSVYHEMTESDEFKKMVMIAAAMYVSFNIEELPTFLKAVNGINEYDED